MPFPLGLVVMFPSSCCALDRVSLTFVGHLVCPVSDPAHHQLLSYEDIRVEGALIIAIYSFTWLYIATHIAIYSYIIVSHC